MLCVPPSLPAPISFLNLLPDDKVRAISMLGVLFKLERFLSGFFLSRATAFAGRLLHGDAEFVPTLPQKTRTCTETRGCVSCPELL